jgi:hypothetical protein
MKYALSIFVAAVTAVASVYCVRIWEWETVTVLLVASLWFQYNYGR